MKAPFGYSILQGFYAHFHGLFMALSLLLAQSSISQLKAQSLLDTSYIPVVVINSIPFASVQQTLTIDSKDRLIIGGNILRINGVNRDFVARLSSTGVVDPKFILNPNYLLSDQGYVAGLDSISVQRDSKTLVSGKFSNIVGTYYYAQIARILDSGIADRSFNAPVTTLPGWVIGLYNRPMSDGSALLFGYFSTAGGYTQPGLAKITTQGTIDSSFRPSIVGNGSVDWSHVVYSAVVQPDGKILICGRFITVNGQSKPYLARLNANGSLDTSFDAAANGSAYGLLLQPDSKILVMGGFSSIGGGSAYGLARLHADGSLDTSFNAAPNDYLNSMVLRADGKILVGGNFSQIGGAPRSNLALLNEDGSANAAYASDGTNGLVEAIALQQNGAAYIFGEFSQVGGQSRNHLARLNPDVPAGQTLSVDPEGTQITWTRSGSLAEVQDVVFEQSLDGTTFKTLGTPARISGGMALTGLNLPGGKSFTVRARGTTICGHYSNSMGQCETKTSFIRPIPTITAQPVAALKQLGATNVTFSVSVTSAATVAYQWKKNGVNISGNVVSTQTESTLTLPGPITVADAAAYTVVITSSAGARTSNKAVLTVITPISVVTDLPPTLVVGRGKSATLTVLVTGTSPVYQWRKNGVPIPGATKASYTITKADPLVNEVPYDVVVSNGGAALGLIPPLPAVTSAVCTPNVVDLPVVTDLPSQITPVGPTPLTFTALVASEVTPTYSWLKGSAVIAGEVNSTFTIPVVALTHAGKYAVKATNAAGYDTSLLAELAVVDTTNVIPVVVKDGLNAVFNAPAAGNFLTYVWKYQSTVIDLVANASRMSVSQGGKVLTVKAVSVADVGDYTCVVTAPGGTLESAAQHLYVTSLAPVVGASLAFPDGMVGASYSYRIPFDLDIAEDNHPLTYFASPLPSGIKLDSKTGILSGIPTKASTISVKVKLSNLNGNSTEVTKTLLIQSIPQEAVGTFVALISRHASNSEFGGRLDLTSLPSGAYSGKLTQGASVYPFSGGKLNTGVGFNNTNAIVIKRSKLASVTLTFDVSADLISGSLSDGSTITDGWRNTFSKLTPSALYPGLYNFAMTPPAAAAPPDDQLHPLGYSYGSVKVLPEGTHTGTGKLADGSTFTMSAHVGPNGQILLYQGYTTTTSVLGALEITSIGSAPGYTDSSITGDLTWLRKLQTSTKVTLYRDGFGPITLTTSGFKYNTAVGQNALGVDTNTNDAQLFFTDGLDVTTSPNNVKFRLSDKNAVTLPTFASGNNPAKVTVKVTAASGLFTGSFSQTDDIDPSSVVKNLTRKATFFGIIVRQGTLTEGVGYGYFHLGQLPPNTSKTLSGGVRLGAAVP